MSIINNGLLLASGADAAVGYQISRSLRFNSADSAYLSRTPGSAGNQKTYTLSMWIKRSKLGGKYIFGAYFSNLSRYQYIGFGSSDQLEFFGGVYTTGGSAAATNVYLATTAVFRDVSAWYHIVLAVDTTQATDTNRAKLYVNGSQVTAFSSATYPSQNSESYINSVQTHYLGDWGGGASYYHDGYIADVYLLDGTATTPSTFAETDAITGQWVPKTPTGISYGTNGFRLTFSDNSGTTSTTLGKDAAGSNNWTPNNFSVASGSGNDSLVDSPTSYGTDTGAGGEVRGNYATLNPLNPTTVTLSNGNLDCVTNNAATHVRGTIGISSGKYYWECSASNLAGDLLVGICTPSAVFNADLIGSNGWTYFSSNGNKYTSTGSSYGASWTTGDVIGVAFDADNGTLTFYKNGTSQGQAFSSLTSGPYFPAVSDGSSAASSTFSINFGQRQWAYAPPSGFRALCDTNLTAPTIAKPANYFDVKLYTGNGSGQTLSGLAFGPDLVWIKNRVDAEVHGLFDQVRGADLWLSSNLTDAETNYGGGFGVTAFTSSGFTVGTGTAVNGNNEAHVAWAWDAASSNSTNTSGTITSTVRANATAGFSIVTYTGNGSAATVGHGLNALPSFFVIKNRSGSPAANNWYAGHTSITWTKVLTLNTTDAASTGSDWTPTSTLLTIPSGLSSNGINYVAYCFSPVAGYSAFGSYTGNGSSDGPFVYTGFRPRWVMIKGSSYGSNWNIIDAARDPYNLQSNKLRPNASSAESSEPTGQFAICWDALSNGFKLRGGGGINDVNQTNETLIYAAFAESPFQYARAR